MPLFTLRSLAARLTGVTGLPPASRRPAGVAAAAPPASRRPARQRLTAGTAAFVCAVATTALVAGASPARAAAEIYYPPASGTFTLSGHGYGHGIGLSQWGAYGHAARGETYNQILDFYYPGTANTDNGDPLLKVNLTRDEGIDIDIQAVAGTDLSVQYVDASGNPTIDPVALPASVGGKDVTNWRATRENGGGQVKLYYSTEGPITTNWLPYPSATNQIGTPLTLRFISSTNLLRVVYPDLTAFDYNGWIEAVYKSGDTVYTVNRVHMEDYLRGVVPHEMPASWTPGGRLDALEAQAVAARSYAAAHIGNGAYDMVDTTANQVYDGVQAYDKNGNPTALHTWKTADDAIKATKGLVRTYNGKIITAMFSASNGGWTAAAGEPYLVAKADPADAYNGSSSTPNAYNTWTTTVAASKIASAYGLDKLTSLVVNSRDGNGAWGGRTLDLTVNGTKGGAQASVSTTGATFRSKLGLRSTWWTTGSQPGAPASVSATPRDQYVNLSWTPPTSDGGAPITSYTVTANPGGQRITVDGAQRSAVVKGLTDGTQYTFSVTATNRIGTGTAATATATPVWTAGSFQSITPTRVYDSRTSTKFGPHTTRSIKVTGGAVPADATAVVLNVTATETTATSYLTVYAKPYDRPAASNLNWRPGNTVANLVEARVGTDGTVEIYNDAGSAHVIVDVFGYYTQGATSPLKLVPSTPTRIMDSRSGQGTAKASFGPGETRTLSVAGVGPVPTNATAVVANLTATDVTATTYVSLWPAGTKQPATSNLNAGKGDTRANTVVLPLGGGKLSVYNNLGRANLIVDILGWYVPAGTDDGAGQFVPAVPSRILDTRTGNGGHYGKLGQGATMTLPVLGRGGVPKTAVSAVVLNVTAVAPTAQTYVTAWPSGQARPGASNLNALPGQIVPNLVIVPVGADGAVQLYNDRGVVDLVADVAGWITS